MVFQETPLDLDGSSPLEAAVLGRDQSLGHAIYGKINRSIDRCTGELIAAVVKDNLPP